MSEKISRRNFLKLAGVSALTTAVMTGCGPAARYVTRKPYYQMPEYNQTGVSTYYASTCRDCSAGCGIIVRTFQGRAIKIEGNPNHPVNQGKICSRGLTTVQELYNPDRVTGPQQQSRGGSNPQQIGWDAAIQLVADAFSDPGGVAFLLGQAPDSLYDLVIELGDTVGFQPPMRYSATNLLDGRENLLQAVEMVYNQAGIPFFDLANAEVTFSFGANFMESWLSPVAYARMYGQMRQGNPNRRGYLVSFEPRMSLTSGAADEWIPVVPGSEGLVAQAIGTLVGEIRGTGGGGGNLDEVIEASGVNESTLRRLAELFANATSSLAIPGGAMTNHANGAAAAQAVLQLNEMVGNFGRLGGVFLNQPVFEPQGFNTLADITALIDRMNGGQVSALFIHGVNPLFELPAALGFADALQNVPLVVSFSSFPDETALQSDYILPDHTGLESFGYQATLAGSDRPAISAAQPVVAPLYNTRSTADVLIAAAQASGSQLGYTDEVGFIQSRLQPLLQAQGGTFQAPEVLTFWSMWLQNGGWWAQNTGVNQAVPATEEETTEGGEAAEAEENGAAAADEEEGTTVDEQEEQPAAPLTMPRPVSRAEDEFFLVVYPGLMGNGSVANRPWMQETPDPMTTVMWNSWVEINPETAHELGIRDDDVVRITSESGEVEAVAYLYPAIRPDTIAIPFGQGHTAYGRYAEGRGVNPADLFSASENGSGGLAIGDTLVKISPTGRRRTIARLESRAGVYGEH